MQKIKYPPTRTDDHVDDYHGVKVPDPYRWLEDDDSPETLEWVERQNQLTFAFLETIPERERIRKRLTELWDYEKVSAPLKRGDWYFQLRNTGLQNQDVLYVLETLEDEGRVLLDPNRFSEDGTVALTGWEVSKDGKFVAYATSSSGSDWMTWRIRHVDSGEDLTDEIEWSKFSGVAWHPGGSAFYYAAYEPPQEGQAHLGVNYYQKLFLHRLGSPQSEDDLIYQRTDQKEWGFDGQISEDGRYLLIHVWQGTDRRNRFFYQDLEGDRGVVELISDLEAGYHFVGNDGKRFYFRTDLDAARGRLIAIEIDKPERDYWETIIAESSDILESVKLAGGQFVALYLVNAYHQIRRFDKDGNFLGEIGLPGIGSILSLNGILNLFGSPDEDELFFTYHSFVHPPTAYRYLFSQECVDQISTPEIKFDFSEYKTQQVFCTSKDGTKVPLFLVHRDDLKLDGNNPTLLYGYGGFNISLSPMFAISRLVWLEMGGVLAVACLRGGGEYGEEWHQAGMVHHKQNVFDDFISCAEYLIAESFTSPLRLAIHGASNGGLLVGACMTQRPELFGAVVPAVGVMDMLRFHKFTIGWAWVSDYGSSDDFEQFKTVYAYSPYHNLKPGIRYPATLIITADHDDRVVPGHSFKFAAKLQACQESEAPVLIRIQTKAGHGYGKPTSILIDEQTDIWSFIVKELEGTVFN